MTFDIRFGERIRIERRRYLLALERVWHFEWSGQVAIIETADEALRLMGVIE